MKDFILAALPWIIIGASIAFVIAFRKRNMDDKTENHMTEGMCIGMCLGTAIGSTGIISLALGISLGMLCGELIGMNIKK